MTETAETGIKYKLLKQRENTRLSDRIDRYKTRVGLLRKEKELLLDRLARDEEAARIYLQQSQHLSTLPRASSGMDLQQRLESEGSASDLELSVESEIPPSHPAVQPFLQPSLRTLAPITLQALPGMPLRESRAIQPAIQPAIQSATQSATQSAIQPALAPLLDSSPLQATTTAKAPRKRRAAPNPSDPLSETPPKKARRLRKTPVVVKTRKVQLVPRDPDSNLPILPLSVGILTLHDLGQVVSDRDTFHNERYIYPVGYKVSREYYSMVNPDAIVTYTCSIQDGGSAPQFIVSASDSPQEPVIGTSATGAWTHIVKRANMIRQREHSNSASGPDYFGFTQPTIAYLIQELPGTELCKDYVRQSFEVVEKGVGKRVKYKPDRKPRTKRGTRATPLEETGTQETAGLLSSEVGHEHEDVPEDAPEDGPGDDPEEGPEEEDEHEEHEGHDTDMTESGYTTPAHMPPMANPDDMVVVVRGHRDKVPQEPQEPLPME